MVAMIQNPKLLTVRHTNSSSPASQLENEGTLEIVIFLFIFLEAFESTKRTGIGFLYSHFDDEVMTVDGQTEALHQPVSAAALACSC